MRLMDAIEDKIPTGVGKKSKHSYIPSHFEDIVRGGANKLIEMGYGRKEDLDCIEEMGLFEGADIGVVSKKAISRVIS